MKFVVKWQSYWTAVYLLPFLKRETVKREAGTTEGKPSLISYYPTYLYNSKFTGREEGAMQYILPQGPLH
jgi:hypothetical protein